MAFEKFSVKIIRQVILPQLRKARDFLERNGVTKRRTKYLAEILGFVFLIGFGILLGIIAIFGVSAVFINWFNLGVKTNVINYTEFVTSVVVAWIAEVPILLLTGFFLHWILRESKSPTAELTEIEAEWKMDDARHTKMFAMIVTNSGEIAAQDCQARLMLYDIKPEDVLSLPESSARFTSETFRSPLKLDMQWDTGKKEVTIRSGDAARVEVMRALRTDDGSVHFEVPSETGWATISVALKTDWYHGWFKAVPLNGKAFSKRFVMKRDQYEGWTIAFL